MPACPLSSCDRPAIEDKINTDGSSRLRGVPVAGGSWGRKGKASPRTINRTQEVPRERTPVHDQGDAKDLADDCRTAGVGLPDPPEPVTGRRGVFKKTLPAAHRADRHQQLRR